jgi:uncharacterized protein Yka (UPF0111/DUF47 family)
MPSWLRKLMPQEEKFFPLFDEHAEAVERAATRLSELLDAGASADAAELDRLVAQGQDVARRIQDKLRSAFVTPFDRSDIKEMTASMQALMEDMRSVARLRASAPNVPLDGFARMALDCARELRTGVGRLAEFDKRVGELRQMREAIGKLRRRMLAQRDDVMADLLARSGGDALAALAASRLLERVGRLVERFDEVADHIDDLVLDHV